jgi:hypothetical protein
VPKQDKLACGSSLLLSRFFRIEDGRRRADWMSGSVGEFVTTTTGSRTRMFGIEGFFNTFGSEHEDGVDIELEYNSSGGEEGVENPSCDGERASDDEEEDEDDDDDGGGGSSGESGILS